MELHAAKCRRIECDNIPRPPPRPPSHIAPARNPHSTEEASCVGVQKAGGSAKIQSIPPPSLPPPWTFFDSPADSVRSLCLCGCVCVCLCPPPRPPSGCGPHGIVREPGVQVDEGKKGDRGGIYHIPGIFRALWGWVSLKPRLASDFRLSIGFPEFPPIWRHAPPRGAQDPLALPAACAPPPGQLSLASLCTLNLNEPRHPGQVLVFWDPIFFCFGFVWYARAPVSMLVDRR